jgi:hypothetical protein
MGHAHHFLSRLDRVSVPHVELALSLYRDEGLLRYLFERAHIPEQTPRVALSLEDPKEGPFLILTRDGKFVTCLAKGMSPGEWPLITRGQLDAIAAKVNDLRVRLEAASDLAGGKGVKVLLRRIYDAADELTREEFLAISALQPLYGPRFLSLYLGAAVDLTDVRDTLIPIIRKTDKPKAIYNDLLRSYWQTLWAVGNLAVLTSVDGAAGIAKEILDMFTEQTSFSWGAVRQGIMPIALRGVWAAARIGKPLLGQYKRLYQAALSRLQNLDSAAGLMAIGARHSRLRAEVEKTLNADIPDPLKGTYDGKIALAIRNIARSRMEVDRVQPDLHLQLERDIGARIAVLISKRGNAPNFKFTRVEDVPPDIARLFAINGNWSFLERATAQADVVVGFLGMVPNVARGAPEDLYFPRDVQRALHTPWVPEMSLEVLRTMRDHLHARPVAVKTGPSRKGPCPCGSGKKYKRCCLVDKDSADNDDE